MLFVQNWIFIEIWLLVKIYEQEVWKQNGKKNCLYDLANSFFLDFDIFKTSLKLCFLVQFEIWAYLSCLLTLQIENMAWGTNAPAMIYLILSCLPNYIPTNYIPGCNVCSYLSCQCSSWLPKKYVPHISPGQKCINGVCLGLDWWVGDRLGCWTD